MTDPQETSAQAGAEAAAEVETLEAENRQEPEPERVLLHMPVDVRSAALGVVALLAALYTLHWAAAVP